MAKIIMIGSQKGGVGKTAVTVMTATALSQEPFNLKTCVIDLDNQKSVLTARNYDLRAYETGKASFEVLDYSISDLQANIARLDRENDLIFLDVAGKMDNTQPIESQEITKALVYVDCLFIPFVSGAYILESTLNYFRFIKQVQVIRAVQTRNLKAYGFINMYRQRTKANIFLNEDIEALKESESLIMMKNSLSEYALFREADTITSLFDPLSNDSAKANFTAWLNEFLQIIQ
jgi:cellulose biosynthesis protein BcsQ